MRQPGPRSEPAADDPPAPAPAPGTQIAPTPQPEQRPRSLSVKLQAVADDPGRERVSVGDLLNEFGPRSFGAALFVFALPNALPISVPGVSAVLGLPLVILALQLVWGESHPWLPGPISRRSFLRTDFSRVISKLTPWLAKVEALVQPRLLWLTEPRGERILGLLALVLALILFLPIPFGNAIPGLAVTLIALGMIERDGVVALAGAAIGAAGLAIVSGVVWGAFEGAVALLRGWFGI